MVLARHILNAIELCKSPILIGLDTWTLVLNNHYYTIITWSCVNKEHMSICYDFPCFSLSNVTNWKFNALGITLDDNKFIKREYVLIASKWYERSFISGPFFYQYFTKYRLCSYSLWENLYCKKRNFASKCYERCFTFCPFFDYCFTDYQLRSYSLWERFVLQNVNYNIYFIGYNITTKYFMVCCWGNKVVPPRYLQLQ